MKSFSRFRVIQSFSVKKANGDMQKLCRGNLVRLSFKQSQKLLELKRVQVLPVPYIDSNDTLVIPFDSDPKYHWYNGGQSVKETLVELGVSDFCMKNYVKNWLGEK